MSGSNTTAAMTVSALTATDASGVTRISWTGSASWAASNGNAANGCADGTTLGNSKTYHMYACQGPSGTCLYASQTFGMAASSAPSGYQSYVRRIFSFTTSSAGAPNAYTADEIAGGAYIAYLASPATDINGSVSTTRSLYTFSVPSGPKMQWLGWGTMTSNLWIASPDEAAVTGSNEAGSAVFSRRVLLTNSSAQLYVAGAGSGFTEVVNTDGWIDSRRS